MSISGFFMNMIDDPEYRPASYLKLYGYGGSSDVVVKYLEICETSKQMLIKVLTIYSLIMIIIG